MVNSVSLDCNDKKALKDVAEKGHGAEIFPYGKSSNIQGNMSSTKI